MRSRAAMLSEYLRACPPFDWRARNCAQFAGAWVQQVERRDVGAPGVADLADSRRVLRRLGGNLRAAVTAELKRDPVPPAMARPGDVVLIERGDGQTLGLCVGRTAAVLTAAGVDHVDMQAAVAAWHIGV